jgi:hypothetical protein
MKTLDRLGGPRLKHLLILGGIATVLGVLGCQATGPAAGNVARQGLANNGSTSLVVMTHMAPARKLQSVIQPYATSYNHIDVTIQNISESSFMPPVNSGGYQVLFVKDPTTQTVTKANIANGVQFRNLLTSTTYRVQAIAYNTSDSSKPISNDASSQATVTTAADNSPITVNVPVVLLDQVFDGTSQGPVAVTGGGFVNSASTETIF